MILFFLAAGYGLPLSAKNRISAAQKSYVRRMIDVKKRKWPRRRPVGRIIVPDGQEIA
jgi:hypothetical protein